mgnify:CR=1 FL=1
MKYMFASDVHGSAYYCRKMLEAYDEEKAERLVLLGDLLYHGPRNDLPKEYAPKEVIKMMNGMKNDIYAVRGNCEAEVDQMVLEFPVMADYCILAINGLTFYATHGHVYTRPNNNLCGIARFSGEFNQDPCQFTVEQIEVVRPFNTYFIRTQIA